MFQPAPPRCGQHEGDELVAIGRIADEARALVLADRHQHGAGRRAVKAPEQVADGKADRRDHAVIRPVMFEVDAEHAQRVTPSPLSPPVSSVQR